MKSSTTLFRPSEHGAAAIEFIVSAIVLFTLVFGAIAVSMAFYTYEVVNEYARDASRYAMVHGSGCVAATTGDSCAIGPGTSPTANAALNTYLNHQIFPGINGAQLQVNTQYAHGPGATSCSVTNCNGAGDQVTVTVAYPYLYTVPFVPQRNFTMHASSTMVISQ